MVKVINGCIHPINEMALVGTTENNLEIVVWTRDQGKIPHFHIFDRNKDYDNEGCIRIDKAEYFPHGGKDMKLNSSQRKELVSFLKSIHKKKRSDQTNWEYILEMWNDNNSDVEIDEDLPMPDYRNLR